MRLSERTLGAHGSRCKSASAGAAEYISARNRRQDPNELEFTPMFHQTRAVGLLTHLGKPYPNFLGSAVAYRDDKHFLTAAHCVGTLDAAELSVALVQPGP